VDPLRENHILVTVSNYGVTSIYETNNTGANWHSIEGNLPDMPVRWVVFKPGDSTQALVATELGVWSTSLIDGASTDWQPSNSGLSNVRCDMIKTRSSDRMMIVATHGRGLFSSDAFAIPSADYTVSTPLTYAQSTVQFNSSASLGASSYYWDFGDGTFSMLANPVKSYASPGTYGVTLTINGGISSNIKSYTVLTV
jgi:PKD repeat protein